MAEKITGDVRIKASTMYAIGDSIRAKGGTSALMKPDVMPQAITDIKGTELNIAYGNTPPTDTSKLWCKCAEPTSIEATNQVTGGDETINLIKGTLTNSVSSTACATLGTNVYVFGGSDKNFNFVNSIYKFDTLTNIVSKLSTTLPDNTTAVCCASSNNAIYIFGGYSNSGRKDRILKFDAKTEKLTTLPNKLPQALMGGCCAKVNDNIYIFGGEGNARKLRTIYKFNTVSETAEAEPVAMLPREIAYSTCASQGNNIYLFGGLGSSDNNLNTIIKFDSKLNVVTEEPNVKLPKSLSSSSCTTLGNTIYVFGGVSSNLIYKFDALNNTITESNVKLPKALFSISSSAVNSNAYIFGGRDSANTFNTVYKFSASLPLTKDKLLLNQGVGNTRFNIINIDNMKIGSSLDSIYRGNANNEGEPVEAYLHNGTDWELI